MEKDCIKEVVSIFYEIIEADENDEIYLLTDNFVRDFQNKFIDCFSKPANRDKLIKDIIAFNKGLDAEYFPNDFVNSVWYFSLVRYKTMHIPLPIFMNVLKKDITKINRFSFRTIDYYNGKYFAEEPENPKDYHEFKESVFREADEIEMVLVLNIAGIEAIADCYPTCLKAEEICKRCDAHFGSAVCIYHRNPMTCPYKYNVHIFCEKNQFGYPDCKNCRYIC